MYWFSEMYILPWEHWAVLTRALSGSCTLSITLSKHRNHRRCLVTLTLAWPAGLEISLVKVCYVLASNCSNTDAACVKEAFCSESTDILILYWAWRAGWSSTVTCDRSWKRSHSTGIEDTKAPFICWSGKAWRVSNPPGQCGHGGLALTNF